VHHQSCAGFNLDQPAMLAMINKVRLIPVLVGSGVTGTCSSWCWNEANSLGHEQLCWSPLQLTKTAMAWPEDQAEGLKAGLKA